MAIAIQAEPVPLMADADGVLRVGGTHVPLDTVVRAFEWGATAEEIAVRFDTLRLADIYAVIGYCLRHRDEIAAYMAQREQAAQDTRKDVAALTAEAGIRQRLERRMAIGA